MKRIFTIAAALLMTASVWAQAPEKMSYQAVVRNASDVLVTATVVGMQISILQGSASGTSVYTETQIPTTNANGLVSLEIGSGTVVSGTFNTIDWAVGPYFIKTETDPTGGTTYTITGTSQLMSVPFALHAKTAESITGTVNYTENDPIFGASVANGITAIDTANWNNHTVDTDTQLDSTGVANLGYVAGGNWTLTGNNINNSNSGNVGIGSPTPIHLLEIGSTDTNSVVSIGHVGGFNQPHSGELVFSENLEYNEFCGIKFQLNGASDNLHLIGGCPSPDTIARFNRTGQSNLQSLRIGSNILSSAPSTLTVDGDIQVNGNINVTGNIAKGGGTFKIDHPLDPENKYLIHSFVESPEMMNLFSGNIITDENGIAYVTMPEYFEAANKDFRYQLTVIGTFAQAIVKEKIKGNIFMIKTNKPNIEVSWSVTSVRADKYAQEYPIVSEVEKELKGSYIHPELFGAGKEMSEDAAKVKLLEKTKAPSNDADSK
mgnify:CR=1 FL=1